MIILPCHANRRLRLPWFLVTCYPGSYWHEAYNASSHMLVVGGSCWQWHDIIVILAWGWCWHDHSLMKVMWEYGQWYHEAGSLGDGMWVGGWCCHCLLVGRLVLVVGCWHYNISNKTHGISPHISDTGCGHWFYIHLKIKPRLLLLPEIMMLVLICSYQLATNCRYHLATHLACTQTG